MLISVALLLAAPAETAPDSSAALADVTLTGCYQLMSGAIKLGGSLVDDNKVLADAGLEVGLQSSTVEALGRTGTGLISQSVIGQRRSGDDVVLFAAGGQMPGCRTILLSKRAETNGDGAAAALTAGGWKEISATPRAGSPMQRRMFLKADAGGQPWLINMFVGAIPGSDLRVLTTVNPVPPEVTLPEGN
jgi:hypothetical protein